MTYAEKLKHPKWQRKRLEILSRDNFKCKLCNDKETTLHVHHLSYTDDPWDIDNEELVTLCEHCHNQVEFIKKENEDFIYGELDFVKMNFNNNSYLYFIRYCEEITIRYLNDKKDGGFILDFCDIDNLNKLKNKAKRYIKKHELDF